MTSTRFVFLGPPGAGKGTLAKLLSASQRLAHISTGGMFRQAYTSGTSLGVEAHDNYWGKGILVPDEVTNNLVFERLQQPDCSSGFILDGYPRTLGQAEALDRFLAQLHRPLHAVIAFVCDEETLVARLASRLNCPSCNLSYGNAVVPRTAGVCDACHGPLVQRPDDREEVVRQRFREYVSKKTPLLEFYQQRGLVRELFAAQPVQRIFSDLLSFVRSS